MIVHPRFNPEAITQYNIVPGLMGVVLTMTLVIITALAITRERERGTMENLLSTPVRPLEVMIGKIVPYIIVGYVQMGVILLAARFLFQVPLMGNILLLLAVSLLLHRRQPGGGADLFDPGPQPAAGGADGLFLLPALDPALRLHVPLPRHAGLGAEDRQRPAADPLSAHRPRDPPQGQHPGPDPDPPLADQPFFCWWP